jgi:hypothetical protein
LLPYPARPLLMDTAVIDGALIDTALIDTGGKA